MPRSTALVTVALLSVIGCGFAGCGFAPAASGGAGASGPLGSGASSGSGTGLTAGGAAQNGHGAVTGMNCAEVPQIVNKLPPDILLVQDASGSMNEDATNTSCTNGCGATSKWALMIPAINMVISETQAEVNWGLKLFADSGSCGVNNNAAVNVGPMNAAPIAAALAARTSANGGVSNGSSTPTRAAEAGAVNYLMGVTDTNPKFIVMATDGQPNCPMSGAMADDDTPAAVAAVTTAGNAGFPTFVVGVSAPAGAANDALNMMAVAGGYPQAGAATQYYAVTDTAGFATVLRTLVGVAASCTFPVPTPPNSDTDRAHIGVVVNGTELAHDPSMTNGWEYTSTGMTAIQIYGPNCDAILAGGTPDVKIVFKCIIN